MADFPTLETGQALPRSRTQSDILNASEVATNAEATSGSIKNFASETAARNQNVNLYPEDPAASTLLEEAVSRSSVVESYFKNLGNKTPAERAEIGAKYGAATGLMLQGPVGALIGAGVGAMAARGIGMVQSGEKEETNRKTKMGEALSAMGVVGEDGMIDFGEMLGKSMPITTDPSYRLKNLETVGNDGPDRSIFELDKTNPFVQRATTTARPLGRILAQGMLGYANPDKDKQDEKAVNHATNMIVNSLIQDADSIDLVYERARVLAAKMGISEDQARGFFSANKDKIPSSEAVNIAKGLDNLYAKNSR